MDIEDLIAIKSNALINEPYSPCSNPTFLPVNLTGGVGDVIMDGEVARFLKSKFQVIIYTKHKSTLDYFYPDLSAYEHMPRFTWHLEIGACIRFVMQEEFCEFLVKEHRDLFYQQQAHLKLDPILRKLISEGPNYDYILPQYARFRGLDRRSLPLATLGY